jgi:hypothetical protein
MSPSNPVRTSLLLLAIAAAAPSIWALDPWESGVFGDDSVGKVNTLTHGAVQQHDLDRAGGPLDQDWMIVPTVAGHSYEARITGANTLFDPGNCTGCGQFERVTAAGGVLQDDAAVVTAGNLPSYDRTIRWVATSTQVLDEYIRVKSGPLSDDGVGSVYTIRFWDTTYGIPRWNATKGLATVFMIQNLTPGAVTGSIRLFNAAGTLLHEQALALGPNQLQVFNSSTIPALAGQSGHAYVVHTAGYGGLAGKAVALEPATGFAMDTAMQPILD